MDDDWELEEFETIDITSKDVEIQCEKNILDASNIGNELDIQPHVGMELSPLKRLKNFIQHFLKKRFLSMCSLK